MSHWFDRWAKKAAGKGLSRRELLKAGVASSLSVASRGLVGTALLQGDALAQPAPRASAPRIAFAPVVVTRDGMTIRHELSFDPATSAAVLALTMQRGTTLIAKVDANVRKDGQTFRIAYGPDVHGLQSAVMTARDGQGFQGTINGRAFTTGGAVASLDAARFSDGRPAPQVNVAQTLPTALGAISADVKAAIRSMQQVRGTVQPLPLPAPVPVAPADVPNQRIAKPAGNWIVPRSRNIPACDQCYNDCNDKYADCAGDFDDISNLLCPPCWAARIAVCLLRWGVCMGVCNVPGGGCCPVPCGNITDNCCGPDTVCMEPKQRTCCPTDRALCGGFCCEKGTMTCAPDGFCGCPGDQVACGDLCCASGDICSDGQCFKPSECTNGVCCHAPSHFCNGTCCAPFSACCEGVCCPNAGACINGRCCPTANRCGDACCATGQACLDPSRSVCGVPPVCTPISKTITTPTGIRIVSVARFPCRTLGTDGRFVSICCEAGVECCVGICCSFGRMCCIAGNSGKAACNFPDVCGPR